MTFANTHPGSDSNCYFHGRCFLEDNRMMLSNLGRSGRSEGIAYLLATGEIVRPIRSGEPAMGSRVASIRGDRLFAPKSGALVEWKLVLQTQPMTRLQVTERKIAGLPADAQQRSSLDENSDSTLLAFLYRLGERPADIDRRIPSRRGSRVGRDEDL